MMGVPVLLLDDIIEGYKESCSCVFPPFMLHAYVLEHVHVFHCSGSIRTNLVRNAEQQVYLHPPMDTIHQPQQMGRIS